MKIQEIKINKFPVVIITDSHTNVANIRRLKEEYPDNLFLCLGDITFLFSKKGEEWNAKSIQYFIDARIPCLTGNHESHILSCSTGDSFVKILPQYNEGESLLHDADIYDLTQQHIDYLRGLPQGFKLILPDGTHYLCFHNRPNDLWSFYESAPTQREFSETYPTNNETRAVIIGHHHRRFVYQYANCQLIGVGRLGKDNDYAILNEQGLHFQKVV